MAPDLPAGDGSWVPQALTNYTPRGLPTALGAAELGRTATVEHACRPRGRYARRGSHYRDLSTVSLLYRNSQRIEWNPYMTGIGSSGALESRDLFRRNEVVFRAEIRVGLEILSTKTLRIADSPTADTQAGATSGWPPPACPSFS